MGHKLVKIHTLRFDDSTLLYSVISYRSHIRGMFEGLGERSETVYSGHTDTSSYMLLTIHTNKFLQQRSPWQKATLGSSTRISMNMTSRSAINTKQASYATNQHTDSNRYDPQSKIHANPIQSFVKCRTFRNQLSPS